MKKRMACLLVCSIFFGGVFIYSDSVNAQETETTETSEEMEASDILELLYELLSKRGYSILSKKVVRTQYPPVHSALDDIVLSNGGGFTKGGSSNRRLSNGGRLNAGHSSGTGVKTTNASYENIRHSALYNNTLRGAYGETAPDDFHNAMQAYYADENASAEERLKVAGNVLWKYVDGEDINEEYGDHIDYYREKADDIINKLKEFFSKKEKEKEQEEEEIKEQTKLPDGVGCYKPNIYIYTDNEKQLSVRFEHPELLTKTIPEYGSGWSVTTAGASLTESCLTDRKGGQYDYLFYESVSSKMLFQTKVGYLILADQREKEFRSILSDVGFNEQEIKDFCEFWTDKLEADADYVMYPQNTDIVNNAMPVTINPQPEKLERIWFLFEEDYGQPFVEPDPYVLDRGGNYTVIEWGGLY